MRLAQITNRDRIALQKAVERLPYSDLNFAAKYSRLITKESSQQELKNNI
jgi:hypothetical protein